MKRFHVHVAVDDLQKNIRFYSAMFGAEPSVVKQDYAKWMLDDPRVNFAISARGEKPGINHLGVQAENNDELQQIRTQLEKADSSSLTEETGTACCYAKSDKYWVTDPQGIAWESFHSLGNIPVYGEAPVLAAATSACCVPMAKVSKQDSAPCCVPTQNKSAAGKCC
jgi:catechol 2,3-dioxygenase-like lactoylglutathione lyase family enzyme